MFKKFIFSALIALCGICASFSNDEKTHKLHIVQLSNAQWHSVQNQVNTNGYCCIPSQNVMIVITNGLPNIDIIHQFPIGRGPEKENKYEPTPYVGQGI